MIDVKAFVETLPKKQVAVFGLGITGQATVAALVKVGADVVAWDDREERCNQAKEAGAKISDLMERDFSRFSCLVLSPGVPLYYPEPHPIVIKARESGTEIIGDLEILHRCNHGRKVIGVTGTNGKSTTTALIGHVLEKCGVKASVGGNIGKAVLDLTMPPKKGAFVLEISSFQMDLLPTFRPDVGVLINVSPDHIDRHGSIEKYVESKERVFDSDGGVAVIGQDDDETLGVCARVKEAGRKEKLVPFSVGKRSEGGVYVIEGELIDDFDGEEKNLGKLDISTLQGLHNHQNICAVYGVARSMGIESEAIMEAMSSFPGLAHRLQMVKAINGVAYVNDSKATNVSACSYALACYKNVYWIAGGRPKEGGLQGIEKYLPRIRHAFLIGEAMEDFSIFLNNHNIPHNFSHTLDHAIGEAHQLAQSERGKPGGTGTVLLSPACASFDQFASFEERGRAFIDLVNNLETEDSK